MKQFFSSQNFVWLVVGLVVASVVYALFLSGSPGTQRALQFDQRRVSDLQQISYAIDEYWTRNQALPETLEKLQDSRYYFVQSLTDPETGKPYEYQISGEKTYELCAVFALSSADDRQLLRFSPKVWEHEAGRVCFSLEIQPRLEIQPKAVPAIP
jgi:hypothetical protein